MHRITGFIITSLLFGTSLYAQDIPFDTSARLENIYRHYSGTVGSRKMVMDFRFAFHGSSDFGSSTGYFTDQGGLDFFRISLPHAFPETHIMRGILFPENIPLNDIKNVNNIFFQTPRLLFTLSNDSLTGEWDNPDTREALKINLKEDTLNAIPAGFMYTADSLIVIGKKNEKIEASVTYTGIRLSSKMKLKDLDFITGALMHFIGASKISAINSNDFSQIFFRKFFADFKSAVNNGKEMSGSNFSGNYTLFPVYNDNKFFVLQIGGYHYDFENKNYDDRITYLCLDMMNKKKLKLGDILDVNNELLTSLLEKAFRKKYQLDPGKKLNDLFIDGKLPMTDNFILVNKGLIFSYCPAKIFKDGEDISELQEMRIFLSYDELENILKPIFKKRIGLN